MFALCSRLRSHTQMNLIRLKIRQYSLSQRLCLIKHIHWMMVYVPRVKKFSVRRPGPVFTSLGRKTECCLTKLTLHVETDVGISKSTRHLLKYCT